jgi:polyisoprenoid-binding protein YceI
MSIHPGSHRLGPEDGTLAVRTKRTGAAAKAGHNLLLHVTRWEATVDVGDGGETSLALTADGASLRVREGHGGMQELGDDDMASIHQSIDDDVLKRTTIAFRSTAVSPDDDGDTLHVEGELTLNGQTGPVAFDLSTAGERLTGAVELTQSDFGIKPFSILFGTLKVVDEVEVSIDASLPLPAPQSR